MIAYKVLSSQLEHLIHDLGGFLLQRLTTLRIAVVHLRVCFSRSLFFMVFYMPFFRAICDEVVDLGGHVLLELYNEVVVLGDAGQLGS